MWSILDLCKLAEYWAVLIWLWSVWCSCWGQHRQNKLLWSTILWMCRFCSGLERFLFVSTIYYLHTPLLWCVAWATCAQHFSHVFPLQSPRPPPPPLPHTHIHPVTTAHTTPRIRTRRQTPHSLLLSVYFSLSPVLLPSFSLAPPCSPSFFPPLSFTILLFLYFLMFIYLLLWAHYNVGSRSLQFSYSIQDGDTMRAVWCAGPVYFPLAL